MVSATYVCKINKSIIKLAALARYLSWLEYLRNNTKVLGFNPVPNRGVHVFFSPFFSFSKKINASIEIKNEKIKLAAHRKYRLQIMWSVLFCSLEFLLPEKDFSASAVPFPILLSTFHSFNIQKDFTWSSNCLHLI